MTMMIKLKYNNVFVAGYNFDHPVAYYRCFLRNDASVEFKFAYSLLDLREKLPGIVLA